MMFFLICFLFVIDITGHKGSVFALGWSFDSKYFASGAADENTIVWDGKTLEGVIRFNHAGAKIQAVAWSPVSNVLVSCSDKDFGFWCVYELGHECG